MVGIYVIEKIIYILLLFRACKTDCKFRIIENKIVLLLLINKGYFYVVSVVFGNNITGNMFEWLTENILFCLVVYIFSNKYKFIYAGDIKLLCVCKLYFFGAAAIEWFITLIILLIISLVIKKMKNVKVPLVPYVLLSVLIVYGIGGMMWI